MKESDKKEIRELLKPDASGNRLTLQAVGDMFGITRERIRQINGNVGRRKQTKKLRSKAAYWRKKLYDEGSVTIEDIMEQYQLSFNSVNKVIGGRCAYEYSVGKRKCRMCGKKKPLDEFYPINNGHGSIARICKKCNGVRTLNYYHARQEEMNRKISEWRHRRENA